MHGIFLPLLSAKVATRWLQMSLMAEGRFNTIYLLGCSLKLEGAQALAELLGKSTTQTSELILTANSIGPYGLEELSPAFSRLPLEHLRIEGNSVGDRGVIALAKILPQTVLQNINLESNQIGKVGFDALSKNLPKSKHLRVLELSHNPKLGMDLDTIKIMLDHLANSHVIDVTLNSNRLNDTHLYLLARKLDELPLTSLRMNSNRFLRREGGVMAIANALNRSLLRRLNLQYNGITDDEFLNTSYCPLCLKKLHCEDAEKSSSKRLKNVNGKNISVNCTGKIQT